MKLRVTAAAKDVVISDGYDPAYGARPKRRSIQRLISGSAGGCGYSPENSWGETVVVDRDGEGAGPKFEKAVERVETPALSFA